MLPTTEPPSTVTSSLVDLRAMPLDEMSGLSAEMVDAALKRILPEPPEASVGAAFQSAI
jgi:hypothetical protein